MTDYCGWCCARQRGKLSDDEIIAGVFFCGPPKLGGEEVGGAAAKPARTGKNIPAKNDEPTPACVFVWFAVLLLSSTSPTFNTAS